MTVVPSPVAVIENVPTVLDVYVYAPQAGDPPHGGGGIEGTKGPALSLSPLTAGNMRTTSEVGRVPMWAAGSLEIDTHIHTRRSLHRQVARLGALENLVYQSRCPAVHIKNAGRWAWRNRRRTVTDRG